MDKQRAISCQHFHAMSTNIFCKKCAEKEMHRLLKISLKKPDTVFLRELKSLLKQIGTSVKKESRKQEAFSLSEIIDKFTIIALKNKYLHGDRLKQNENDYRNVEQIIRQKLTFYSAENLNKIAILCKDLWLVNAEIFCVNDICGGHKDDRVVAAAARKMIALIKERNRIKHAIANEFHEDMYETKQFQK